MKKILFITHDTSRTGAPLVLLYFMQWLDKKNTNDKIDCLSLGDGPLKPDFETASNQFYLVTRKTKRNNICRKIFYKIFSINPKNTQEKQLLKVLRNNEYDLIYANSVVSLQWGNKIKTLLPNSKLILHLHELGDVIEMECPKIRDYITNIDFCICASKMVSDSFNKNYSFSKEKSAIVYEFSKNILLNDKGLKNENKRKSFIVGGSGSVNKRKGYDLFIAIAKEVNRQAPNLNFQFNWIGKIPNKKIELEIKSELEKTGMQEIINFNGEESSPFNSYNSFDIFLMTSREDPFPLVCIEVARLGKPIICFENATGTQEIINLGGGKVVPYLSIYDMALEVINYANNRELLKNDGLIVQENFKTFTVDNQAPKIYDILNSLVN